jgi:hypothetical protein
MTGSLIEPREWLASCAVTHVAIESTAVLRKPVWSVLEEAVTLVLVNPP